MENSEKDEDKDKEKNSLNSSPVVFTTITTENENEGELLIPPGEIRRVSFSDPIEITHSNSSEGSQSVSAPALPSSSNNLSTSPPPSKKFGYTRRQWVVFFLFCFTDLFTGIIVSIQAPFYPAEAEKKGVTASEYGFVFGIYDLVILFVSPVYGIKINKIGAKKMFNIGIFICAFSNIAFGCLDRINDKATFLALSYTCRVLEALGSAAYTTASFTIITIEFPGAVGITLSTLETLIGVGLIFGPTVGGALFELGGFLFPFTILGASFIICGFFTIWLLPEDNFEQQTEQAGFKFLSILKVPGVALSSIIILTASIGLGFVAATLEPHIRHFNLSPLATGAVFISSGGMYAFSAPIFGIISDKVAQPKYFAIMGIVIISLGFILIGPLPFLPFETILWVTIIGLILQGIGCGASFPSAIVYALKSTLEKGFPDNLSTNGILSGLWSSAFALGFFIGPTLGGVLLDIFGFRIASAYIEGLHLIIIFLMIISIIAPNLSKKKRKGSSTELDGECQPLIAEKSTKMLYSNSSFIN